MWVCTSMVSGALGSPIVGSPGQKGVMGIVHPGSPMLAPRPPIAPKTARRVNSTMSPPESNVASTMCDRSHAVTDDRVARSDSGDPLHVLVRGDSRLRKLRLI